MHKFALKYQIRPIKQTIYILLSSTLSQSHYISFSEKYDPAFSFGLVKLQSFELCTSVTLHPTCSTSFNKKESSLSHTLILAANCEATEIQLNPCAVSGLEMAAWGYCVIALACLLRICFRYRGHGNAF